MTTFPALIPQTRTYTPGEFPHTPHRVYGGSEARVRHSNTVLGVRLRLFFPAITSAELLTVIAHYNGQRGRFLPFAIPVELLSGTDTPADFTPAGHQWRYAAKPTVEDISVDGDTPSNLHNLTVELETVPPENTIIQGVRLRVRADLRAGSTQLGEFFDVQTTLDEGTAASLLEFNVPVTFEPGSPFPVVTFDVVATLDAGAFVPPPDSLFSVTATLAAGAAGAAGADSDPYFANVSLLLPLNGADGSTTFTDFSSNALTVTQSGGAAISTAASLFGTGVLRLEAANQERLNLPSNSVLDLTGDFTLEFALYTLSDRGGLIGLSGSDNRLMLNQTANAGNAYRVYLRANGTEIFDNVAVGLTGSAWRWIAITRSGTTMRLFGEGTIYATTTYSGTLTLTTIGRPPTGGYTNPDAYFAQVRVTKGVARYTANYTPSPDPFPTS